MPAKTHGHSGHNKDRTRTYRSWDNMKQRCLNPNRSNYKYYGGRGITVCTSWYRFESFFKDMGERPLGCSLERLDVNGNYTLENCSWVTHQEQCNNRRKR